MEKNAERQIESIVAYITLSELKKRTSWKYQNFDISYYDYPEPFSSIPNDPLCSEIDKIGAFFSLNEKPDAINEPLNTSLFRTDCSAMYLADRKERPKYSVQSCKRLFPKDVRGKVRILTPIMVEVAETQIFEDGTYEGARSIFGYAGNKLIDITERRGADPIRVDNEAELISAATHLQLIRRYKWKVGIKTINNASLGFISSPSSIRDLFRWRDVPEGKQRRAAIRNWVSAHYRKNNNDESDDIWVKKHLRGVETFIWNGLEIKVFPPKYEVEQLAKQERRNTHHRKEDMASKVWR